MIYTANDPEVSLNALQGFARAQLARYHAGETTYGDAFNATYSAYEANRAVGVTPESAVLYLRRSLGEMSIIGVGKTQRNGRLLVMAAGGTVQDPGQHPQVDVRLLGPAECEPRVGQIVEDPIYVGYIPYFSYGK